MLEEVSEMSENCRSYQQKMEAKRRVRLRGRLRTQLLELMTVVARCEHIWTVEERIERAL